MKIDRIELTAGNSLFQRCLRPRILRSLINNYKPSAKCMITSPNSRSQSTVYLRNRLLQAFHLRAITVVSVFRVLPDNLMLKYDHGS